MSHYWLVHTPITIPKAMKIPAARAASDEKRLKPAMLLAWTELTVRAKANVTGEDLNKKTSVHLATIMDVCHWKHSKMAEHLQMYRGQVALRGDIVKYDAGCQAVFAEQGASASHMTSAQILDTTTRLPGIAGETIDAISKASGDGERSTIGVRSQSSTIKLGQDR